MGDTEPQQTAIVLHLDSERLVQAVDRNRFPEVPELLQRYAELTRSILERLCGLRDFSHVVFKMEPSAYKQGELVTIPFCIVVGPPKWSESEMLEGVSEAKIVYDVLGALTARSPLPGVFAGKMGWAKGDASLRITDAGAHAIIDRFTRRLRIGRELDRELPEDPGLQRLREAMSAMVPPLARTQPVQPDDLLMVLPLFVAEAVGIRVGRLGRALKSVRGALGGMRGIVWRAEDIAKATAKFAVKASLKAGRPALIGFVVYRTLGTIGNSRTLENRMSQLPHADAVDLYCKEMLGKDYGKQIEQDLMDAIKDVDEGLCTDDYKDEKRRMAAAMLRRLEVEEWDKERMKHFYYGSHGLGPWYFDMEERLRNPYFLGSRGWNGPIESWVGKNKAFHNDLPRESVDFNAAALRLIENDKGVPLTDEQKARILQAEQMPAVDSLMRPGSILDGLVDKDTVAKQRQ